MANDINGPLRNVLPGNIDQWNRVYATVAEANAAIPSTVVGSRNFREGKVVQIGTVTDFVEHHWFGGFGDGNLVPKLGDLANLFTEGPVNLITSLVLGRYSTDKTLINDPLYKATNFISALPGQSFVLVGVSTSMSNNSIGGGFGSDGNRIYAITPQNLVTINGGRRFTLPPTAGVVEIVFYFNQAEADSIKIYKATEIPKKEVKPEYLPAPVTKISQIENDLDYLTPETGMPKDEILDPNSIPPNLITLIVRGKYYSTSATALVSNPQYSATNLIPAINGSKFAISGVVSSLTNNSIGAAFGSGDARLASITPANLTPIEGGYLLTVSGVSGITRIGMHFNESEIDNVLIQAGDKVIKDVKIYPDLIPTLKLSEQDNDSGFITSSEAAPILSAPSDVLKNSMYDRGASVKLYSPLIYAGILAGQSQINGRTPFSELPQSWIEQASLVGNIYSLTGVKYWNTTSGPFVDFNLNTTSQGWSWDALLFLQLRDYMRTKKSDPNYTIYAIKDSLGGTAIDPAGEGAGKWTPYFENISTSQEALLKRLEKRFRLAKDGASGGLYDIRYFIWDQGESDRIAGADSRYYQNLKNVIQYVRGFVGNPRLPVIVIGCNTSNLQYSYIVDQAKRKLASEDFFVTYVEVANGLEYMNSDKIHINYLGAKDRADKVFPLIKDLEPQTNTLGGPLS